MGEKKAGILWTEFVYPSLSRKKISHGGEFQSQVERKGISDDDGQGNQEILSPMRRV